MFNKEEIKKYNPLILIMYGSFNYNLNTEESDKDYRGFTLQKELKNGVANFEIDNYEVCINHLETFMHELLKLSPKYIELLFSDTILISKELSLEERSLLAYIFNLKNDIVKMNLKRLYNRFMEEYHLHMKWITDVGDSLDTNNYYIHSYRLLDILIRFYSSNFKDYKNSIKYGDDDFSRNLILNFKKGLISLKDFNSELMKKLDHAIRLEEFYNITPNIETEVKLMNSFKRIGVS